MRYVLYGFAEGRPTKEKPVGMNDILGIGEYRSAANAMKYLTKNNLRVDKYKSIGLYTLPNNFRDECRLVASKMSDL